MTDALIEADAPGAFQMQSWSSREARWTPMEDGAASKVWRPVSSVKVAVRHCIEWTGTISIPAMRVVDLRDGEVAWQDSRQDPDAGAPILPAWADAIAAQVRIESRSRQAVEAAIDEYVPRSRTAAEVEATDRQMLGLVGVTAPTAAVPALVDDGALFTMEGFDV